MTTIGILEWFRPGDRDRVEQVLKDLKTLAIRFGDSYASRASANRGVLG